MMPRDGNLSGGCTPDHCGNSSQSLKNKNAKKYAQKNPTSDESALGIQKTAVAKKNYGCEIKLQLRKNIAMLKITH